MTGHKRLVLGCNTGFGVFFLRAEYCGFISIGPNLRNSPWCLTWDRPTSGSLSPTASARQAVRNEVGRGGSTLEGPPGF